MTTKRNQPITPDPNAFQASGINGKIHLVMPMGRRQDYLDKQWGGFRSISEESLVLTAGSNIEFRDFTLYPNPARDKVHIDPRSGEALKQVNIYTMAGAFLYSVSGPEINTGRLSEGCTCLKS